MKLSMIAAALAALSLAASPAFAAQSGLPCLGQRQAEDMVVFLLPTLIEVAQGACGATLPPGAALADRGLADRYRAESEDAWPAAKKVIGSSDKGVASLFGDSGLRDLITGAAGKEAARILKPDSCAAADRLAAGLSPLPARNVAQVVVALFALARADDRLPVKLCPAPSR